MAPLPDIQDITLSDLQQTGLSNPQAQAFFQELSRLLQTQSASPPVTWKRISQELLTPSHPYTLHKLLYHSTYKSWNASKAGPPPAWIPDADEAKLTNVGRILEAHGSHLLGSTYKDPIGSFDDFYQLSVQNPEVYWKVVLGELNLKFHVHPSCILNTEEKELGGEPCPGGRWLPGAALNAAECCLQAESRGRDEEVAILWREEGHDDSLINCLTIAKLRAGVSRVANALQETGFRHGDAIAINMPMNVYAVTIYLAIILAGCVVVSIADSFAASEIASRLVISKAKGIFTQNFAKFLSTYKMHSKVNPGFQRLQCLEGVNLPKGKPGALLVKDVILRGQKTHPLFARVAAADGPRAFVLPACGDTLRVTLRPGDLSWADFLAMADAVSIPEEFQTVAKDVEDMSNILFSSGTTGDPKAIPWTHATPIKAAADAWAHHDIRHGDVIAWPTNLGWMMGPWLIYAALLNRASIALYNGAPLGHGFAKFIQDARVTMLGIVPSMVKAWRSSKATDGYDWSHVRCFSSSGEASSVDDYLWLMSRANYKPVIEYCGGTEIGGAFATGSMLQPQSLSTFSTPAMGCTIIILDERGNPLPPNGPCIGECALDPSIIGASSRLLNANHFSVYFKDMPQYKGKILRRHGDEFERTVCGYYRAHGRVDDTMNLGGIKVSSVEIERVCNGAHEAVLESAAIGVAPGGGGPEQLLIIAVLKGEASEVSCENLKKIFNASIQSKLNPLFKVSVVVIAPLLPRTASNKVVRRMLRSQYGHATFLSKSSL